jgi:hypothetical protein
MQFYKEIDLLVLNIKRKVCIMNIPCRKLPVILLKTMSIVPVFNDSFQFFASVPTTTRDNWTTVEKAILGFYPFDFTKNGLE